jgi:hypothetical protein
MTATEIRSLLGSDPSVYLHYTDDRGLKQIHAEGVIRMNTCWCYGSIRGFLWSRPGLLNAVPARASG